MMVRFKKNARSRNLDNLHVIPTQSHDINKSSVNNIVVNSAAHIPIRQVDNNLLEKSVKLVGNKSSDSAVNQLIMPVNCTALESSTVPSSSAGEKSKKIYNFNCKNYERLSGTRKNKKWKRDAKRRAAMQATWKQSSSYHWYNPNYFSEAQCQESERNPSSDIPVEEGYFEEVEVASYEYEDQKEIPVGFRRSKIQYLKYKKNFFKPKIFRIGSERTIVNCLNLQDSQPNTDVDVVSEAEYEAEFDDEKPKELNIKEKSVVVERKGESNIVNITCGVKSVRDVMGSRTCVFKTSISDNNFGLKQAKSKILKSLVSLKSHLIGLEYLIEIQNETRDSIINYYCVLCKEELLVEDSPAAYIINHINKYKHVVKYLEKHFPVYGYRFSENSDYNDNIIILQKICEEINHKLGYYHVCVVDVNSYKKYKEDIYKIINNSIHPSENDTDFDKSLFQKPVEHILSEDVSNVINDVIEKVLHSNEVNAHNSKSIEAPGISETKGKNSKLSSASESDNSMNSGKNANSKKSITKYNSESAMASYLKLKYHKPKFKICMTEEKISNKPKLSSNEMLQNKTLDKTSCRQQQDEVNKQNLQKNTKEGTSNNLKQAKEVSQSKVKEETHNLKFKPNEISQNNAKEAPDNLKLKPNEGLQNKIKEDSNAKITIQKQNSSESSETVECIVIDSDESEDCEIIPNSVKNETEMKEIQKSKAKSLQKPAIHSKHCRKRILGNENPSLTAKELRYDASNKTLKSPTPIKFKKSVTSFSTENALKLQTINKAKGLVSVSKKIIFMKHSSLTLKDGSKSNELKTVKTQNKSKSPLRKVVPIPKPSGISTKLSTERHLKNPDHIHVKKENNSSKSQIHGVVKNVHTLQKTEKNYSSSVVFPRKDYQHISKNSNRKLSRSPLSSPEMTLRRMSRSPANRITSPLRLVKNPVGRHPQSPIRRYLRNSVSPFKLMSKSTLRSRRFRRRSRSPVRRKSRSPFKRGSRSPHGIHARSPFGRHFRSPIRISSRSPLRKHSRSPGRKHFRLSRSPLKRHSRSPVRRHSRSPVRKHSRSPTRRYSRSPTRRYSRSPTRRHSRSPRRHSRSPSRRHSRSPARRYSRSPLRRHSRSPPRRHSRSPPRRHSRSPINLRTKSPIRDSYRVYSHNVKQSDIQDKKNIEKSVSGSSKTSAYDCDIHDFESSKRRTISKRLSPSGSFAEKHNHSRSFVSSRERDMGDLDPVSDEDESVYFNTLDKRQQQENIKLSSTTKTVLSQLLQKFSMTNINQNDPTLRKLMQFMEAHSSEIQGMVESQSDSRFGSMNPPKLNSNVKERSMFLQQYLLSNLAGNTSGVEVPPSPAMIFAQTSASPTFSLPPFPEEHGAHSFVPPSNIANPCPPQPVHNQQFFPPNLNVPPPAQVPQFNHPSQELSPASTVAPEAMFKDLKATVSKLFGANENVARQEKNKSSVPSYVSQPDPDKWDLNHPNIPKFSGPIVQKNMLVPQGKNMDFGVSESSSARVEIPGLSFINSGQYFSTRDRPQISNMAIPPPDTKVSFCDVSRRSVKGNLFPVVHSPVKQNFNPSSSHGSVSDVKLSLAQRLASVLVKVGMIDVPAPLLQEMLMKIGAFSSSPPQDIREAEIVSILKRLGYLS